MPDSVTSSGALIDELRHKIKDTAWLSSQFSISARTGSGVSAALLQIDEYELTITPTGAAVVTADLSEGAGYDTVQKLVSYLSTFPWLSVNLVEGGNPLHSSTDLEPTDGTIDIYNKTHFLRTRRWSDSELEGLLRDAMRRHNLVMPKSMLFSGDYDLESLPDQHRYFVVLLGQIEVLKSLIYDSSKARGLDLSIADFDTMKRALEEEYHTSIASVAATVEHISPIVQTQQDQGNVVVGHTYRTSLRRPYARQVVPDVLAPAPRPIALRASSPVAGKVLLEWTPSPDLEFSHYEVWRGATDAVSNKSRTIYPVGSLVFDGKQVFHHSLRHRTSFVDGVAVALPPGTFYYRIYTFNRNGAYAASDAVSVTVA